MKPADSGLSGASFRDPEGQVFRHAGRIFRTLTPAGSDVLHKFLLTEAALALQSEDAIVRTWKPEQIPPELSSLEAEFVEHEAVPFPSFPAEWCPEMLVAAGRLTLELCERCLPFGWGLKDATPFNVLFRGPQPIFVDLLSFEGRIPNDPAWGAYAQFVRSFLLPLVAGRDLGLPLQDIWLNHRDGLEPESLYQALPRLRRFTGGNLGLITLPALMTKGRNGDTAPPAPRRTGAEETEFILASVFRGLRKRLRALEPSRPASSMWSNYTTTRTHYEESQRSVKAQFVARCLEAAAPRWCLDVGANTGEFSEMAAECSRVVAIDYDVASVGRIWRRARQKKLDILPLCVNICRPTPATGWRNSEQSSFLDRCAGRFDMVMMLAVTHHMLVTERIPVEEIVSLATELTSNHLIIEYVGPRDPMFRQLLRGRDALHQDFGESVFESALKRHFRITAACPLPGMDRKLYWVQRGN